MTGAEEVRRHLEAIGKAGEQAGNTTRAALLAASSGANTFTTGTRSASASSGQLRFALQNLSFQANDIATSLASGGDVMRVFAQQSGQIVQAFTQGGGFRTVLGGAASAIAAMITPTTAAVAALAALGVGIAALTSRAASAEASAKQFDVILKATGRSGGTTGKELEAAAERLHDVGLSASEAREQFKKFIGEGGIGRDAEKVTRIGAELNKVLGEGSMERFRAAAAQGGPALEDFARKLGIVVSDAKEVQKQLDAARASADNFNRSIEDALRNRNKSLSDAIRDKARQLEDLTRQQGRQSGSTGDPRVDAARQRAAQEEDIETQSARRIEDINRQHAETINNIILQRNQANAAALATYNDTITTAAQQALDKSSLIQQIAEKVFGSFQGSLSPIQQAIVALSTEWNKLLDTLAKSEVIRQLVQGLGELVGSISQAIEFADKLAEAIKKIPGLPGAGPGGETRTLWGGRVGLAAGGLVRGPGTGTSDSIGAFLSNGEFVVNALATRMNLPVLQAINAMRAPIMPRFSLPRGFAMGGLVGAGGGGTAVHVHFSDGSSFGPMMTDARIADGLVRHARKRSILSAGKKPSTA